MSAFGDFIVGFKRGFNRAMKPKPQPDMTLSWIDSMILQWQAEQNERFRTYRSDLQKRGVNARSLKPQRIRMWISKCHWA